MRRYKTNKFIIMDLLVILLIPISLLFGYITLNSNYVLISTFPLMWFSYILIYYIGFEKKIKLIQFLLGDFTLKNDNKNQITTLFDKFWIDRTYLLIGTPVGFSLILFSQYVSPNSLIIGYLSLISISIALTILTFNYKKALSDNPNEKELLLAGARRLFLGSIYAIFTIIPLFLLYIQNPLPRIITQEPLQFIGIFLRYATNSIVTVFFILIISITVIYLLDGLILSLKENIEFN